MTEGTHLQKYIPDISDWNNSKCVCVIFEAFEYKLSDLIMQRKAANEKFN
jgi:hypothetical protein